MKHLTWNPVRKILDQSKKVEQVPFHPLLIAPIHEWKENKIPGNDPVQIGNKIHIHECVVENGKQIMEII
jgi:hypothetical protein